MYSQLCWIRHVYIGLLYLYPTSHRQLFGAEMYAVFEQALMDAAEQSWLAVLAICLRELRDLPQLLLTEYGAAAQQWAETQLVEQKNAPPGLVPIADNSGLSIFFFIISVHPRVRRLFDIFCALIGLLLAAPLLLIVPLLVKFDSSGPVIFRQVRMGKNGRPYAMYKFRSMHIPHTPPYHNPLHAPPGSDPRLTRVGRFTRLYHLDEIPQLFNVLRGEMSILGARPQWPAQ